MAEYVRTGRPAARHAPDCAEPDGAAPSALSQALNAGTRPLQLLALHLNRAPRVAAQRTLQRMLNGQGDDEEEPLQAKTAASGANRTGLPDTLKTGAEGLSGLSLDHVRVHYNSPQPAQLQAEAFAQGGDIHVAPGRERHLPHEAWHVVQQLQGRVRPTLQAKGAPINDDPALEREADIMGERAARPGVAQAYAIRGAWRLPAAAPVQLYRIQNGAKISGGNQLALTHPTELFAGDTQFAQANDIADGEVAFLKGKETFKAGDNTLARVVAMPKKDTSLGNQASVRETDGGQTLKEDRAFVVSDARKSMPERATLIEELKGKIRDEWRSLNAEGREKRFGTSDIDDMRDKLATQADEILAKSGVFEKSQVAKNIELYFKDQEIFKERPLMYSDCKGLAIAIAGFLPHQGEETDEIAPGVMYEFQQNPENEQGSEWPFHYATIIMTDGADHATMENAGGKVSGGFKKLPLDRTWFFALYGPEKGQTFDDAYAKNLGY